jgi:hypothetical protein
MYRTLRTDYCILPDEGSGRSPDLLVSLDYLFGERDGMAVFEAPDSATAAAVALVIGSSGAFRSVATHELVSSMALADVLRKAAAARPGYARPGE